MTSLTEVYNGSAREVASLRRLYAGASLVCIGAVLAVVAVLMATTDLFAGYVDGDFASVRAAGILAGIGVPTALVGVFIVLPADRRVRAASAISVSLCLLGVVLFSHAYPTHWRGYGDDLTLHVSVVYLLGLFIGIWCLFTAVVTFKTRNDPGGMLEMNVTRHNQTIVEVDEDDEPETGYGGVGFLGTTPDGDVETQTNASSTTLSFDEGQMTNASAAQPTSDGGAVTTDISSPLDQQTDGTDAEFIDTASDDRPRELTDRYCGNCSEFEYVRSSSGMVPYCARHEERMDDMDACEEWTPNRH